MNRLFRSFLVLPVLLAIALPAAAQQVSGDATANFETRLSAIEDQMRALNGKIEQLDYSNRHLTEALQRQQDDVNARLTHLEATPAAVQPTVPAVPPPAQLQPAPAASPPAATATTTANGTLGAIKMQDGKVVGGVNNPQSTPLPDAPPEATLTPQEQYDRAFGFLRQANYDEAEKAFKAFVDKNPQDKLIANAKYWYGETLYVRGKFDAAAVAFADAYQQDQKGPKAPDSLLKLAMSLENLNKASDACATLDSLKSKFPNAALTVRSRADEERQKLKCGH